MHDEDRWAYTPEALASLKRARADIKAGYVFELAEKDVLSGKYPKRPRRTASSTPDPGER